MMRAAVTIALLAAAGAAGAAEQPIGRLFFTPAERAQLDAARSAKRVAEPATASKPAVPPPPETQIITYSGIVRRSDGKSILWLNSRATDEKEALSGLAVTGRVRPDGAVTLEVPNTGGTIDLKVGQRAELQTGRVSEARPGEKGGAGKAAKGEPDDKSAKADPKADKEAPAKASEPVEKKTEAPKAPEPADPRAAARPSGK